MADIDKSVWHVSTSKLECKLNHSIPEYGFIEFFKEAGEPESSELQLLYPRFVAHERAELYFTNPGWQPSVKTKEGWKFQMQAITEPIELSNRQTRQLLDNLAKGYQPVIYHNENTDRRNDVYAIISPVMFRAQYATYTQCIAAMIPVSWDRIRKSDLNFETGSARLSRKSKRWLEYVLEYARDPAVRKIELTGYTDSIGNFRANHQLASSRVEMVRNYLVNAGFDERKLRLKVYGEQHAQHTNNSKEGRAKNRRVEIKMYR